MKINGLKKTFVYKWINHPEEEGGAIRTYLCQDVHAIFIGLTRKEVSAKMKGDVYLQHCHDLPKE